MSLQGVTNIHPYSLSETSGICTWTNGAAAPAHCFLSSQELVVTAGVWQAHRAAGSNPRWTAHRPLLSSRPMRAGTGTSCPSQTPCSSLAFPSPLSPQCPSGMRLAPKGFSHPLLESARLRTAGGSLVRLLHAAQGCSPSGLSEWGGGRPGQRAATFWYVVWELCLGTKHGAGGRQAGQCSAKNNATQMGIWELFVQNNSEEKDTRVPAGSKLYVSQQCILAAKKTKSREVILLLHNWEDQASVQVWAPWATAQLCESPHITNSSMLHLFLKGIFWSLISYPKTDLGYGPTRVCSGRPNTTVTFITLGMQQ